MNFGDLAQRLGLAAGEDEILMTQLHSLAAIAAADYPILQQLPLEESTKQKLHEFFGSQANPYPATGHSSGTTAADNHHHHHAIHDNNQTLLDDFYNYNEFQQAQDETFYPPPVPTQVTPFHQPMTSAEQNSLIQRRQPYSLQGDFGQTAYSERYQNSHFSGGQYQGDHNYGGHQPEDRMMTSLQPMNYFPSETNQWASAVQTPRPYTCIPAFAPNYSEQRQQPYHRPVQMSTRRFHPSGYLPGNSAMGQYYV
jgi:hypothetical protein